MLSEPYSVEKGRLIVLEMTDNLVLELVDKGLVTDQIGLTVGYDASGDSAEDTESDRYGRMIPRGANGSANLGAYTSSSKRILKAMGELYDRIVKRDLPVRRMSVAANRVLSEAEVPRDNTGEQLSMFADIEALDRQRAEEREADAEERRLQQTLLDIKKRFGKNAILKGMNFEEGATGRERNEQVGGHKA